MIRPKEKNTLLVRADIGQPKPFTHTLPLENHAYGMPLKREQHGAAKLTSEWQVYEATTTKEGPKDFRRLNRMQIANHITDNRSLSKYRRENDVRVTKKRGESNPSMGRMASVGALLMSNADQSFGKPNRAQTPVKGIICGDYGTVAENHYKKAAEDSWIAVSKWVKQMSVCRGTRPKGRCPS